MGDSMPAPGTSSNEYQKKARIVRVETSHYHIIAARLLNNVAVTNNLDRLYGQLGLPEASYAELKLKNPSTYLFLKAMLAVWVSRYSAGATWNALWVALEACELQDAANILEALFTGEIFPPRQ